MKSGIPVALFLAGLFVSAGPSLAQNASLAQKVQLVKQIMAANKQQLSRYTWQTQETISVNGGVKEQTVYQVQLGPDGQQVNANRAARRSVERWTPARHHTPGQERFQGVCAASWCAREELLAVKLGEDSAAVRSGLRHG